MLEQEMTDEIRRQYLTDKQEHEEGCVDGYLTKVNIFTREIREDKCPYCIRFNKAIYND